LQDGPGDGGRDGEAAWVRRFPNLVLSRTFSKAYGLAGLRVGYSVAQPAMTDLLNRVRQPFNVNSLAQAAAVAALGDTAFLERSRALNAEGVARLARSDPPAAARLAEYLQLRALFETADGGARRRRGATPADEAPADDGEWAWDGSETLTARAGGEAPPLDGSETLLARDDDEESLLRPKTRLEAAADGVAAAAVVVLTPATRAAADGAAAAVAADAGGMVTLVATIQCSARLLALLAH
jgi:hypothetical protein